MAAQRQEEEQRLQRNVEARMREKQEEAHAREKIRLKLGQSPGSTLTPVIVYSLAQQWQLHRRQHARRWRSRLKYAAIIWLDLCCGSAHFVEHCMCVLQCSGTFHLCSASTCRRSLAIPSASLLAHEL